MRGRYISKSLLRLSIIVFVAVALLPSAVLATEFVTNGGLTRALAGGGRCEASANAFGSWTLSGGCTWYDDDALQANSMGGPNPDEPKIIQPITIPGNLTYTLTFRHMENEYRQSGSNVAWNSCWGKATVYYYSNSARTALIGSDTTGNLTCSQKAVWATATMTKTTPANCVAAKVEVVTHAVANGATYGFSDIDDISLAACIPIVITGNIQSQVKDAGQTATFSIANTGESPSYVWEKKPAGGTFAAISGAISRSYTTPTLSLSDSGAQYRCKVSNSCTTVYSNTVTLTVISPVAVSTIAQAKTYEDGTVIRLPEKPVSMRTSAAYWIQDTDQPSGIKISSTAYPVAGSRVSVTGTLNSTAGERRIDPLTETWGTLGLAVKPYFMGTKALGGARLNEFSPGVATPFGPNNIGLFVKIYGTVKNLGGSYYYLDDGAGLKDGTLTNADENVGVRITAAPGALATNETASATGVVSTVLNGDQIQPALVMPGCSTPNAALTVSSVASALCSGQSTSVTVGSTESDVTYQLRNGSVNVGSPVLGTGGTINLPTGNLTTTTTFNVLSTRNVGGCSVQLTQTRTITVIALPIASLAVGAQPTQIDAGQSTNVTVASSQTGVSYQLRKQSDNSNVGSPVAGTGGTINLPTGIISTNGNYTFTVLATNTSGCSQQLTQTVRITVGQLGTLTGRLLTARMQPIIGAVVALSGGVYSTTTNTSGSFTLTDVVQGTYDITFTKAPYQTGTWQGEPVLANVTRTVPDKMLPHNWSKVGAHIISGNRTGWGAFLQETAAWGKPCQLVKCLDDFGAAGDMRSSCPEGLTIGRVNDTPNFDMQGLDRYAEPWSAQYTPPAQLAQTIFNELRYNYPEHYWAVQGNRDKIDVWEVFNEWSSWWDYQADFYIAMMDIMEAQVPPMRLAMYGASTGNPPVSSYPAFARCGARAKAHGGHIFSLHEYGYLEDTMEASYRLHGPCHVTRYRQLYDYLRAHNADAPCAITECGGGVGVLDPPDCSWVDDIHWYDDQIRQDDCVLGCAVFTIGSWNGPGWYTCFPAVADYICNN